MEKLSWESEESSSFSEDCIVEKAICIPNFENFLTLMVDFLTPSYFIIIHVRSEEHITFFPSNAVM